MQAESQHVRISDHKLASAPRVALDRVRGQLLQRSRRLRAATQHRVRSTSETLERLKARWDPPRLIRLVVMAARDVERKRSELTRKIDWRIASERRELLARQRTLAALDPKNSLRRGFSLVYDAAGNLNFLLWVFSPETRSRCRRVTHAGSPPAKGTAQVAGGIRDH